MTDPEIIPPTDEPKRPAEFSDGISRRFATAWPEVRGCARFARTPDAKPADLSALDRKGHRPAGSTRAVTVQVDRRPLVLRRGLIAICATASG
jgi:hypothetical protein